MRQQNKPLSIDQPLISVSAAAERTNQSEAHIRWLIDSRQIDVVQIGGAVRLFSADFETLEASFGRAA